MTIPDHIVALALLAIDDPDAVQVLEDAMIEDGRDWNAVHRVPDAEGWHRCVALTRADSAACRFVPCPRSIRAFGLTQYWGSSWPVAERCRMDSPFYGINRARQQYRLGGATMKELREQPRLAYERLRRDALPPVCGDALLDDDTDSPLTGEGDVERGDR